MRRRNSGSIRSGSAGAGSAGAGSAGAAASRRRRSWPGILAALLLVVVPVLPVSPADRLSGPIAADVVTVTDGDTLAVRARIWLGQIIETRVRLRGIDAPEANGACPAEREQATAARRTVITLIRDRPVQLYDIQYGKFAGRVLARVETADGVDLAHELLRRQLVRRYGGGRRKPWCAAG